MVAGARGGRMRVERCRPSPVSPDSRQIWTAQRIVESLLTKYLKNKYLINGYLQRIVDRELARGAAGLGSPIGSLRARLRCLGFVRITRRQLFINIENHHSHAWSDTHAGADVYAHVHTRVYIRPKPRVSIHLSARTPCLLGPLRRSCRDIGD